MSDDTPTPPATKPPADDWKAPASQDELNAIIETRLARERKRYEGFDEYRRKADEFDKAQDAQKSEAQRQADTIAALQAKVDAFESAKQIAEWSAEIVKDSSVPASALRGSTRDELEAHFNDLKALIPDKATPPRAPDQKRTTTSAAPDAEREFVANLFGRR